MANKRNSPRSVAKASSPRSAGNERNSPRSSKRVIDPSDLVPLRIRSDRLAELDAEQRSTASNILKKWIVTSTKIPYIDVYINHEGNDWQVLRGTDIRLCATSALTPFPNVVRDMVTFDTSTLEAQARGIEYSEPLYVRPFNERDLVDLIVFWKDWYYAGNNELVPAAAISIAKEPRLYEQPCWDLLGDLTARERSIWLLEGEPGEAKDVEIRSDSLWREGWRLVPPDFPGAVRVRDKYDVFIAKSGSSNDADEDGDEGIWSHWEVLAIPHLHTPESAQRIFEALNVPRNYARVDMAGNVHIMRNRLDADTIDRIWDALIE